MPTPENIAAPAQKDPPVAGVVLAAGAGIRFGSPKALAVAANGTPWLVNAVRSLLGGGCSPVLVVLGAAADEADALLADAFPVAGASVRVVRAEAWESGMSASLGAALARAAVIDPRPVAVAIVTVDVPSLDAATVRRVAGPEPEPVGRETLRQAFFSGRPGHPVVIGRAHWDALRGSLEGDVGARPYLLAHAATIVDCSDLGSGIDIDTRVDTP